MEDVAGTSDDLLRRQADALAVVVHRIADLDQELFQRRLRQVGGSAQLVAEGTIGDRVVRRHQFHAIAAGISRVEGTVQDVGAKGFLGLDQGLRQVTGVGLADTDVVAIFHQHFGQGEGKAIHPVHITLNEEDTTRLVGDRHAVREFRRGAEAVQDGFFVVVTRDAVEGLENGGVFICTLRVDAVELFVQDRFND